MPRSKGDGNRKGPKKDRKAQRVQAQADRTARRRERNRIERQLATVEAEIAALEKERDDLERQLADPTVYEDPVAAAALARRHRGARTELESRMAAWEQLSAQLDASPAE